ncbi:hypothetical protein FACS1894159_03970 [Bacteroidia bacterium]|nr:hypothetical protein FACS1894159_03970 [Bacteroidia bacterium]
MRQLNLLLLTTFTVGLLAAAGASGAAQNPKSKEQKRTEQITASHNRKLQAIISPDQTRKMLADNNYHAKRRATQTPQTPAAKLQK